MKKYYLQDTAEEVKIGDMIVLDLTEDMSNGKVKHHHMECKFIPPVIPLLIEQGIIEVQEVKEKKMAPANEIATKENLDKLMTQLKDLQDRANALTKMVATMSLAIAHNASPVNSPKPHKDAKKAGRK